METLTDNHTETTAIVGGGASGLLVAAHLARSDPRARRILVFEPGPRLGAGVAFSTDHPRHLLNVPARSMSAFDDAPDDFVDWTGSQGLDYGPNAFVPRGCYRRYLQEVLARAQRDASRGSKILWVHDHVEDVLLASSTTDRASIVVRSGAKYTADSVVFAVGAPRPSVLRSFGLDENAPGVVTDPWRPGALRDVPVDDALIIGTGLTMIDVTILLSERAPCATIHARSRTGLMPATHTSGGFANFPALRLSGETSAREVVRRVHEALVEADLSGWDWRNVIAALRDFFPPVWGGLPDAEKKRLLRLLDRRWDVHRHRMSEDVAAQVTALLSSGRLTVRQGRVARVAPTTSRSVARFDVTIASARGQEHLQVGAVIDCSSRSAGGRGGNPLLETLIARGAARAHPSGLGLDVGENGALVDVKGSAQAQAYSIGWCRRGQLFESTAIPELRKQADQIARAIVEESRTQKRPPTPLHRRVVPTSVMSRGSTPADVARPVAS
ncbi:MAG TPA: FAD/NAD(P)-binding protein [Acidimicrobiales bacterium]|nr:FAD/NAD(P)-binding protein [Acidimicrobiales bacterium]